MNKYLILIALVITLTGCASISKEQVAEIRTNAINNATPQVQALISQSKIRIGMTQQEVIAAWGAPESGCRVVKSSHGDMWQYCNFFANQYRGTRVYFNNNNEVTRWVH